MALDVMRALAIVLCLVAGQCAYANHGNIIIVAHPATETRELSANELRRIFSKRQTHWSDGTPINVFVYAQKSQVHQSLCKEVLHLFPYQLERFWNKFTYSGLSEMPEQVSSHQEMLRKVRTTPGAIGYSMNKQDLDKVAVIQLSRGH